MATMLNVLRTVKVLYWVLTFKNSNKDFNWKLVVYRKREERIIFYFKKFTWSYILSVYISRVLINRTILRNKYFVIGLARYTLHTLLSNIPIYHAQGKWNRKIIQVHTISLQWVNVFCALQRELSIIKRMEERRVKSRWKMAKL